MSNESMKDAARCVVAFHDELMEQGFNGTQLDRIVAQAAPVITSYVLYGHTTIGN